MTRSKTTIKFTYQDYLHLPDDKRYELIEGELKMVPSPPPSHQDTLRKLLQKLDEYVTTHNKGRVYISPVDVVLSEENVVQPDLLFISKARTDIITDKNIQGAPDLVIEVLSPATEYGDREIKRKLYAKFGVKEYWVVNNQEKNIEVMRPGKTGFEVVAVYRKEDTVESFLLPEMGINLKDIFENPSG